MSAPAAHRHRIGFDLDGTGWSTCPGCGVMWDSQAAAPLAVAGEMLRPDPTALVDPYEGVPPVGELVEHQQPTNRRPAQLANLPAEFWGARPILGQIREAAHHHGRSADLVLAATMTRLSAMVDPGLRFDTGLGPGSLNLFAAVVAPSGVGKTAGVHVAQDLLPVPSHLPDGAFSDGLPLGSGEGLAEAFMGMITRETGKETARGKPQTERVRAQVRANVFFYLDEGEALTRSADRRGATIGSAIRSAWVGASLGQANASGDTTRILPRGSYALGLLIGFQRATALPLLADAGPGTPQRFFWASAVDPSVPEHPPERTATLYVELRDVFGDPFRGVMMAEEAIRKELWTRNLARVHGDVVDDDLDSHEVLMRSKLAALLALMDGRHDRITLDDWALAETLWRTSCGVRDSLIEHGKREAEKTATTRERVLLDRKVREVAELDQVPVKVARIAQAIAARVEQEGGLTAGAARKALASRDRSLFEAAVERAAADGLIVRADGLLLAPGGAP